MKKMKKLAALFLAVVMVMAMGMTASAAANIEVKGALEGATYTAYKIFDVKTADSVSGNEGYSYTRPVNKPLPVKDGINQVFSVRTGASDIYYVPVDQLAGSALADYLTSVKDEENFALDTATSTTEVVGEKTVVRFNNLADGYYYVVSNQTDAVAILRAIDGNTTTITEKKTESGWGNGGKQSGKLTTSGNDTVLVPDQFYAIGDTIDYEVTYEKAYNYVTGTNGTTEKVIKYNAKDEMPNGVELDPKSVKVTVIESDDTIHENVSYIGTPTTNGFEIEIKWAETDTVGVEDFVYPSVPAVIKINYSAEVKQSVNAGEPLINKAYINYNGKNTDGGKDNTVYTGAVTIRKFDGENGTKTTWDAEATKLTATFKIYKKEKDDNNNDVRCFLVRGADGKIDWMAPVTKGTVPADATDFITTGGRAEVKGLDAGTYYLLETVAPNGYNALPDDDTAFFEIAKDGSIAEADLKVNADVPNEKGTVLPSTGGIGTTIFYVVGGILVLGAGVLLITKKRMSAK